MSAARDQALNALEKMPESATWDEIMYEIYVRAKIAAGLKDVEEGNLISHEDIERGFIR